MTPSLYQTACCSVLLVLPLAAASLTPFPLDWNAGVGRRSTTSQHAQEELASLLDSSSTVLGPASPEWANVTERWDTYASPTIQLVVTPGVESDVSTIVRKFCFTDPEVYHV